MQSRSKTILKMALQKAKSDDALYLLNIPRYETQTTTDEERQRAITGFKLLQNAKPYAFVPPQKNDPSGDELPDLNMGQIPNSSTFDNNPDGDEDNVPSTDEPADLNIENITNSLSFDGNAEDEDEYVPPTNESSLEEDEEEEDKEKKGKKEKDKSKLKGKNVEKETAMEDGKIIVINEVKKDVSGRIIRTKGHSCMYCHKVMINLPRHLETMHASEIEVAKLLAMPKNSTSRRTGFIDLARIGDYYHNVEVLTMKSGELILVRRPSPGEDVSFKNYSPCPYCLGFMLKKHLWHHVKHSCTVKKHKQNNHQDPDKQHSRVLVESRVLLLGSLNTDQPTSFIENILKHMRDDRVTEVCKEDSLILKLGLLQFEKHGQTQGELIRQQMRQLGRLVLSLRKLSENDIENQARNLNDWLHPKNFDELIAAVKDVCIQNDHKSLTMRPEFQIPSLALKLGHTIRKCIGIERGIALRACDKAKNEYLKDLLNLMDLEWSVKISSNALATLYKRKLNKTNVLPLTSDLVKLNEYLLTEIKKETNEATLNWYRFAELNLCRLILFNKRRSGEASRLRMETYLSRSSVGCSQDVQLSLTEVEKKLTERMGLIETIGKRGKKVPIILTPDMKENLEKLINNRQAAGVNQKNEYVFARTGDSLHHIRGHDCLTKFSKEAQVEAPHLITSTNLRKYIATVVQIFNMTENETDWLARHLGHDIRVHREFYRSQESVVETAKISRILLAVEQGKAHLFKGKKLEDINVVDLNITDESENPSNDESTEEVESNRPSNFHVNTDSTATIEEVPANVNPNITQNKSKKKNTKRNRSIRQNSEYEDSSDPEGIVQQKIHRRSKNPRRNTSYSYESDDSSIDGPKVYIQPHKSSQKPMKSSTTKRPWTTEEKNAVITFFRKGIQKNIIPRKEDCENCKRNNAALERRSWREIKYYVYNYAKKINKNLTM